MRFLLILLFLNFSAFGNDFCKQLNPKPVQMEFFVNYGAPFVKKVTKSEMVKLTQSEKGVGITEAKFSITYKVGIETINTDNGICVYLKKAEVLYGYPQIKISILSNFKENSCQYKETLKHENQHVNVHQQLLKKYSINLEQTTKTVAKNIQPILVQTEKEISHASDLLIDKIDNDERLQKIRKDFEKERYKINSGLDTEESYQEITSKCKSWN